MNRLLIVAVLGLALAHPPQVRATEHGPSAEAGERPEIVVYKSPYCGCCGGWAKHMEAAGYSVITRNVTDLEPVKQGARVPDELASCHTAIVDGYVIEGHVPASAIDRLLAIRPAVRGLAVPGMPIGSPGMEGPQPEPYNVLTFDKHGRSSVFMSVPAGK